MTLANQRQDTESINWIPQAILNVSIAVLEEKCGVHFTEGRDDLDKFMGTEALDIDGHHYMMRHYSGYPANCIEIYLPFEVSDTDKIVRLLALIVKQLHIPSTALTWRRGIPMPSQK
jgi:hypothetical protein